MEFIMEGKIAASPSDSGPVRLRIHSSAAFNARLRNGFQERLSRKPSSSFTRTKKFFMEKKRFSTGWKKGPPSTPYGYSSCSCFSGGRWVTGRKLRMIAMGTTMARVHELISDMSNGAHLGRSRISGGILGKYFQGY